MTHPFPNRESSNLNVKSVVEVEAAHRLGQGRRAAAANDKDLLERPLALPDGERKAEETKRTIERLRTFIGYREHPKYGMVSRYFVYKRALLAEADRLVDAGVIAERDDIHYLTFDELQEVVRTGLADHDLIRQRQAAFRSYRALSAPRVLTSEGEGISGRYRREDEIGRAHVCTPVHNA